MFCIINEIVVILMDSNKVCHCKSILQQGSLRYFVDFLCKHNSIFSDGHGFLYIKSSSGNKLNHFTKPQAYVILLNRLQFKLMAMTSVVSNEKCPIHFMNLECKQKQAAFL